MAPELREVASGPGVLVSAEGVSVRQTVDQLKIPRASVNHGTSWSWERSCCSRHG